MTAPAQGTILADKYRVSRILGEGGMGLVVEAFHLQLEQRVAIKFLHTQAMAHSSLVTRFAREARAMIRIKSEHVARVIDVGTLDSGAPYMVMEYLEGKDLEAVVAERGPLPCDRAVEFVLQACEALAEAHTLGIIHRDLKPSNLFLTARADRSDCVKVLDFGISKTRTDSGEGDVGLTQTSAMLGSPLYMAPEQMSSAKQVDERTDIWALGAILFELLTASPPFPADSIAEIRLRIERGKPLDIRAFRDDVPADLEAVVLRCLATDPSARFANLAELASALVQFAPPEAELSVQRVQRLLAPASGPPPSQHAALARTEQADRSGSGPGLAATPPPSESSQGAKTHSASAHVTPVSPASSGHRTWIGAAAIVAALAIGIGFASSRERTTSAEAGSSAPPAMREEPPPPAASVSAQSAAPSAIAASEPFPTASSMSGVRQNEPRTLTVRRNPSTATPSVAQPTPGVPASTANADLFNTRK